MYPQTTCSFKEEASLENLENVEGLLAKHKDQRNIIISYS